MTARCTLNKSAGLALVILFAIVCTPGEGLAYEKDTHYYLTFAVALRCGYTFRDAHKIASSNLAMDLNETTVAGQGVLPFPVDKKPINRDWHALNLSTPDKTERRERLWRRVRDAGNSDKRLVYLGQFLHFAQDEFAHLGYDSDIGHGIPTVVGIDPDSLGRHPNGRIDGVLLTNVAGMVRVTVERLCAANGSAFDLERLPASTRAQIKDLQDELGVAGGPESRTIRGGSLVEALVDQSNPAWKEGDKNGSLLQIGRWILENNRKRIERYLRENAPGAFPAGIATLPDEQVVRYDAQGEVLPPVDPSPM